MKTMFVLPFLLFSIITSDAQTYKVFKGDTINRIDLKGRKQGLWRKYYKTDTLFSEGHFKDDKHHGTFKTFHRNGSIQSLLVYRGNSEISDATVYNDSAQMIAKGKYIDKSKDSLWVYFTGSTGKISADEFYKKGEKAGIWKVYYSNGKVAESEVYKKGMKNGPYKKYFENGKLRFEGNMIDNELEGNVKLFFSDGTVWQQGIYLNGDKNGVWTIYKEDGSVEKEEEYIKGILKDPEVLDKQK